MLVATGRRPYTDGLGLEAAGVAMERGGAEAADAGDARHQADHGAAEGVAAGGGDGAEGDAGREHRLGHVASITHPGANITGIFVRQPELAAKRVEFAHQALSQVRRLALWGTPNYREQVDAAAGAARTLGLETVYVEMNGNPGQSYLPDFKITTDRGAAAIVLPASGQVRAGRAEICKLALSHRIPLIAAERELVEAGALLSYGVRLDDAYREAANYIDRIARGERAGDLPLKQPTRFELVLNLKTAKTLGVDLPPTLLSSADEVIE